jgi:hypothetical protein
MKAVKNGMGMEGDQFNWYIKKRLEVICKTLGDHKMFF